VPYELYRADCFEVLPWIETDSVDLVLADPPYGTTPCKWDRAFDFGRMWAELNRIVRSRGAIVLTASQPFTSQLIGSNLNRFKCEWIWHKNRGSNIGALKHHPFKEHESVVVFSTDGKATVYFPILQPRSSGGASRINYQFKSSGPRDPDCTIPDLSGNVPTEYKKLRLPSSVQRFNTQVGLHPTQKPVPLCEYFIKTYSQPGEVVLDFCMGSGTTGVAALNTERGFIGIELDPRYYGIAERRIREIEA
jgi:site-specific DNA-methyltransferase (adenine-specific)